LRRIKSLLKTCGAKTARFDENLPKNLQLYVYGAGSFFLRSIAPQLNVLRLNNINRIESGWAYHLFAHCYGSQKFNTLKKSLCRIF
jgi:hypothetical protein